MVTNSIYVDGELYKSPTVMFDYDFSQRHILVVSDDCTVENEIKVRMFLPEDLELNLYLSEQFFYDII